MKTCPVCGAQAADDAKFCFSCGKSFISEAAPGEPEKPEAPASPMTGMEKSTMSIMY